MGCSGCGGNRPKKNLMSVNFIPNIQKHPRIKVMQQYIQFRGIATKQNYGWRPTNSRICIDPKDFDRTMFVQSKEPC